MTTLCSDHALRSRCGSGAGGEKLKMENIEQQKKDQFVWWHSLMYATGFLLLVCGIPATVILCFSLMHDKQVHLDRSEALIFGGCMVGAEAILASVLLFVAERITKRKNRKSQIVNHKF